MGMQVMYLIGLYHRSKPFAAQGLEKFVDDPKIQMLI
ncbi:hypothetical protein ES703_33436 [subsurface metagenome]